MTITEEREGEIRIVVSTGVSRHDYDDAGKLSSRQLTELSKELGVDPPVTEDEVFKVGASLAL